MSEAFYARLPIWLVVLPLAMGPLCYLLPERLARRAALAAAAALGLLIVPCSVGLLKFGGLRYAMGNWAAPLGIELRLDGLSLLMLILTVCVGVAVTVYATCYFPSERGEAAGKARLFWPLWFLMWAGLHSIFMTADCFNAYVALEILTICAIALVTLAGRVEALIAATRYLYASLLGSLMYLLGVGLLYSRYGALDMPTLGGAIEPGLVAVVASAAMVAGLLVKAAAVPMHFWLPAAHANAPAPVSAMLSSLVVMSAFYLLLRLWLSAFPALVNAWSLHALGFIGVAGIVWGGLQALRQRRLKLLIAYSTISQTGYLLLALPLLTIPGEGAEFARRGVVCLALSTGLAKAAVFLVAGALEQVLGDRDVDQLGGLAHRAPVLAYAFGIAGLSLAALPPSGGFVAKWLLLKAALASGQWAYVAALMGGGALGLCYVFRVIERALAAPGADDTLVRVPWRLTMPALFLAILAGGLSIASHAIMRLLDVTLPGWSFLGGGAG